MCSADNGIYLLETKDGFRVTECQGIENIYWWPKEEGGYEERKNPCPQQIVAYFGQSNVYKTIEDGLKEANRLYEEISDSDFPIIEYGIQMIDVLKDEDFPTDIVCKHYNTAYVDGIQECYDCGKCF